MNQNPTSSNNTVSGGLSRRSFLKKSALSVGAIAVLGQGTSIAAQGATGVQPHTHVKEQYMVVGAGGFVFWHYRCKICKKPM